jgi:hypothetical protein
MTEMTATFDADAVVDAIEEHRLNINEGMFKQMIGDTEGALEHAIKSINLLMETMFGMLSEDNRRELRQLTADTKGVATYFQLDDDVEWCDEYDRTHA